ncbi:MAG TPA: mucoidy inhibitor MuiA family protein [Candidatus Omnitrophota bacterium]|nr:mucoidy inhibitor MuiA family protein [Candidatus Omnitrophota bacterium]
MKKFFGVFALVILSHGSVFAEDIEAQSRISQVTVYSSSAFVTRSAKIPLPPGDSRVIFANIIPDIDENSLRVKGKGSAEVKILGAQVKRAYTEEAPAERVQQLQAQIQSMEDQHAKLDNEKLVLTEEKQYLDSVRLYANQQIPKDLVTKMPPAQELEATLNFLGVKLRANFDRGQEIDIALREGRKKLDALKRQLGEISGSSRNVKRSIVVEIEAAKAGDLEFEVSYMVNGASWNAVYDARTDFERSEVELVSHAVVRQSSGENWEDVALVLSTAQVSVSGKMPDVNSWFIRPYQPPVPLQRNKMYADKSEHLMSMESAVGVAGSAPAALAVHVPEKRAVAENLYAMAEAKGVSVSYKLTRTATIKTDGTDHKLPVSSQILKASFEYSAYPRITPLAYLRSLVTNAKDLQLLGGHVNVFFEGDFVGTSWIESIAPGQEFDLYMGSDENVKIKRELLEKKADDVLLGGIPSPNRKMIYKYKLTAENYKTNAIKMHLFEAIPVSEDERIKVKVTQLSVEPKQKDWKDKKGIWRWELQLEPKAKQEIFYTCTVEFPRDMRVEGLE